MHLNEILQKIQNVKKQGNEYTGRCPGHDDKQNSLSISEGKDGRILIYCHAGCSTERIVETMGIKLSDLYPEKESKDRKQVAEYLYKDLAGNVIHKTIRFEPKGFTQCRPDEKGGWIYNLKDIKTVLYNLQKVKEAINKGETVYIVEGEKDVDNLAKLGLTATTSPQGAGKWKDYYSDYLINAIIAIIPDNDTVGKSHSEQVARSLQVKAKSIKVIDLTKELPELPLKADITDFFKKLGKNRGLEALKSLVDNAEEWKPQEEQNEELQTQEEAWELPIPFDNFNLPQFPTHCFPDWVAEYIEAVAEDTQTPEDMAAVVTLGILSIPCNRVYKVEGKSGWLEPTSLYCTMIAKPGERKSSIMAHITRPIYDFEAEENERLKPEIAKNQTERKILEDELQKLRTMAAKDNNAESRAKAMDKAEELENFEDIKPLRLTCDDVSPEKLAGLLADNNGRIAIVSAEGGIFDIMSGRYSQNTNIDVFLKGHAGDPLRVDRIGRASEYIKEPALSLVIAIQPEILTGIMQNSSFRGRGLTARFLYSMPTSKVGARNVESNSIPEYVKNSYLMYLKNLLHTKIPETPYILKLSNEAYRLSVDFAKELEPRLVNDLEPLADWGSKLHGAILRIAGILHVAEHVKQNPWEYPISEGTFQAALMIGRYFIEHAKAAFALMGADKNIDGCKHVIKWIQQGEKQEYTKTDIFTATRGYFREVANIEPVLKLLCEYGYLREIEQKREGAGRKPCNKYIVNPYALNNNYIKYNKLPHEDNLMNKLYLLQGTGEPQNDTDTKQIEVDEVVSGDEAIEFLRNGGAIEI